MNITGLLATDENEHVRLVKIMPAPEVTRAELNVEAGNVDKTPPMCYFGSKGAVIINRSDVRQVLNLPCSPFVDFAIQYANLTPDERESIEARERLGLTITEAAIHQNMCETRHKNLYRKGMDKLTAGWDGQPWIYGTLNAYRNIKQ